MRETRDLEFKESVSNSFLKTVSAYANYSGGRILFGVNDEGVATGLPNPKQACLDIENKINDSIAPQPSYALEINEPDSTVELRVNPGLAKPYLYRAKAYKRNDSSTIEVDDLELSRLLLAGRNTSFEELPASEQNLSFECLKSKIEAKLGLSEFTGDTLKTLGLQDAKGVYNNAAAILADSNGFPGIDAAVFGESISIIKQRLMSQHQCALAELDETVKLFESLYCYEEIDGVERERRERIPLTAFREALANALVHRAWDIPAPVRVAMFDDRVEVSSPGGLPSGLTVEEYLNDMVSVRRNRIIADVFLRLGLIEAFGTGILRIKEAYSHSLAKPQFNVTDNVVLVVLPVVREDLGFGDDERAVYELLGKSRAKAAGELEEDVSFGRSKLRRILKELIAKGVVEEVGRGRGLKYRRK